MLPQKIEPCAAKATGLEKLEPIDLTFSVALAVVQDKCGDDGLVVTPGAVRNAA